MNEYYQKRQSKYLKKLSKQYSYAKNDLESLFGVPYVDLLEEAKEIFVCELLEDIPYIGANNQHEIDLVDSCYWVALFIAGKNHNIPPEKIGRLMTDVYEKMYGGIPKFLVKAVRCIAGKGFFQKLLKLYTASHKKSAAKYRYAWDYEYKQPNAEYSHKMVCVRCGFAMYMQEKNLTEYMPYICNLDYLIFGKMGLPLYRNKVIGYGDDVCTMYFKLDENIPNAWPPHGLSDDGLK
ncbi:MAG: L-2-amino-thiazoline-4-carboxylic acid hydrolase [Firmicutes bacterium]|nr:L-2-amino-thiazoline-4-carboxylic acid hydrolase [Bacillota bacterium]